MFILIEDGSMPGQAIGGWPNLFNLQRYDFFAELVRRLSRSRPLMASHREFILYLPRNPVTFGNAFGGETHIHVDFGDIIDQPRVRANTITRHRHEAHRLCATCNDDISPTRYDALGGHRDGLQPA